MAMDTVRGKQLVNQKKLTPATNRRRFLLRRSLVSSRGIAHLPLVIPQVEALHFNLSLVRGGNHHQHFEMSSRTTKLDGGVRAHDIEGCRQSIRFSRRRGNDSDRVES